MSDLAKINRDKAKSQGFAALGVPIGATLVFKKDPAIVVKTLDDKNKVEYQGKPYSISTLAKQLVGSPVSGYLYFKYEGKALKSLVKNEVKPVIPESPVSEPSEDVVESSGFSEESDITGESGQDTGSTEEEIDIEVGIAKPVLDEGKIGA
jgi:hypothetical protein